MYIELILGGMVEVVWDVERWFVEIIRRDYCYCFFFLVGVGVGIIEGIFRSVVSRSW